MFKLFKSYFFNFEYLRVLGTAPYQGAEIGECLEVRERLRDGDSESWYREWYKAGEKAVRLGEDALASRDFEGARWAFLRASNYFRSSEFFLHCNPSDPRIKSAIETSALNFDKAATLMDGEVLKLSIPYENNVKMPARLFMPPRNKKIPGKTPIILQIGGFDSTGEELFFYGAAGAAPRGYAVLSFDGPGQGLLLRQQPTQLRPDWEVVSGKCLDYITQVLVPENPRLELDADRIAVLGSSLGGYLALRAGADPRVKATISCDGCYDMFDVTKSRMPSWFINSWLSGSVSDSIFNFVVNTLCKFDFQMNWEFGHSFWVYGVETPADVMRVMQKFTLILPEGKQYLQKLEGAILVMGAADTFYFVPELNADRIYANLDHLPEHKKMLWVGQGGAGGGLQAKIAALGLMHQRMFSWLDGQFGVKRSGPLT